MEMNNSGGNWHSITDALDVIGISRGGYVYQVESPI